jgi:HD-like signal output (HDOD) protein
MSTKFERAGRTSGTIAITVIEIYKSNIRCSIDVVFKLHFRNSNLLRANHVAFFICSPDILCMIDSQLQTKLLQRARRLYTLPEVALDVLSLTQSPLVDLSALRECLERDPALTAKILRLVNSSVFGRNRGITSLQQALAVLGINPLKTLVLGLNLPSTLFLNIHGDLLRKFWQKSLAKAALARELGKLTAPEQVDELFLAGLLGDVGTLLLMQELGDHYSSFLRTTLASAQQRERWEIAALGFDHTQLGGAMLRNWKLADVVCRLVSTGNVEKRQRSLPAAEIPLARILELADRLAWCWMENRADFAESIGTLAEEHFRLSDGQLMQIASVVSEQLEQLSEVFAQHQETALDCERITQEVLARLAELSTDHVARELRARQLKQSEERCDAASLALRDQAPHAWRRVQDLIAEHELAEQNQWPPFTLKNTSVKAPTLAHADTLSGEQHTSPLLGAEHLRSLLSDEGPNHAALLQRTRSANLPSLDRPVSNAHDAALRSTLTTTILQCRQSRSPLSLVLIFIPGEPEKPRDRLTELFRSRLRQADLPGQSTLCVRPREFAVTLPDCERRAALQWAGEILRELQPVAQETGLSLGVASIAHLPRNFSADTLINAARRCLDGALLSGGNTVKSIEVS